MSSKKITKTGSKQILEQETATKQNFEQILEPVLKLYQMFKHISQENESLIHEVVKPLSQLEFFQKGCNDLIRMEEFVSHSVQYFNYVSFKRGQAIFHHGEPGDKFYIVLKGSIGVYVPRPEDHIQQDLKTYREKQAQQANQKNQERRSRVQNTYNDLTYQEKEYIKIWNGIKEDKLMLEQALLLLNTHALTKYFLPELPICVFQKVFTYTSGGGFGEVSLTTDQVRSASLVVESDEAHLITLTKSDYKRINERQIQTINDRLLYFMNFFEGVSKQTVTKFISFFHDIVFNPNTVLWKEGDIPEYFFLISHGLCEISRLTQDVENNKIKSELEVKHSSRQKRITLITLSSDAFVGHDDIIEGRTNRTYSCKITEITHASYMKAEDFNNIKKIYPDIVKCLKQQNQLIASYMQQRQQEIINNQKQIQENLHDLQRPQENACERRTIADLGFQQVKRPVSSLLQTIQQTQDDSQKHRHQKSQYDILQKDQSTDKKFKKINFQNRQQQSTSQSVRILTQSPTEDQIIRSSTPKQISKQEIALKKELLHDILLKRSIAQVGEVMKEEFNLVSKEDLDQLKERMNRKFSNSRGFSKKVDIKKSHADSSEILTFKLTQKKDKRLNQDMKYISSVQSLVSNVPTNQIEQFKPIHAFVTGKKLFQCVGSLSRKSSTLLLSRAQNPKHQNKEKLFHSLVQRADKDSTKFNSMFGQQPTSNLTSFEVKRIHSAAHLLNKTQSKASQLTKYSNQVQHMQCYQLNQPPSDHSIDLAPRFIGFSPRQIKNQLNIFSSRITKSSQSRRIFTSFINPQNALQNPNINI